MLSQYYSVTLLCAQSWSRGISHSENYVHRQQTSCICICMLLQLHCYAERKPLARESCSNSFKCLRFWRTQQLTNASWGVCISFCIRDALTNRILSHKYLQVCVMWGFHMQQNTAIFSHGRGCSVCIGALIFRLQIQAVDSNRKDLSSYWNWQLSLFPLLLYLLQFYHTPLKVRYCLFSM